MRTRTTFSPRSTHSTAVSALNTALPDGRARGGVEALGDARGALASAAGSNWSRSSWSTWAGSIRAIASSLVIVPSSTMSAAMRTAAAAVRFAERVWSMYSRPRSIVNSRSWTSR